MITSLSQLDLDKTYSYADYLVWQLKERVELIRGKLFPMSPAPSRQHQELVMTLVGNFFNHFRASPCKLYTAPFDVRLTAEQKVVGNEGVVNVVQPDLCVVCDKSQLDDWGCVGGPDLVVEVLSPGNTRKEMQLKFGLYQENGVKEYWVVFPPEEMIQVFRLNATSKYELAAIYNTGDLATSKVFPGLCINLSELFAGE